jgi:DNA-binding transcriptional LysR family regulator
MMDSLSGITAFIHVAETRSFTEAGRLLEISSSAVGKSVARMEERLGVRLFHRSTRSVTLTTEGELFLDRCKRILSEVEAAEMELLELSATPRGKVRISVPIQNVLIMPVLAGFMRAYPDIELDVDMSDRMVDVIEEGFDAVIRTGAPQDSRLMARKLGGYQLQLVASPAYLERHGDPTHPDDLIRHVCLLHKFPATGMIERWPLRVDDTHIEPNLTRALTCTTMDPLTYLAIDGAGIAAYRIFQSVGRWPTAG